MHVYTFIATTEQGGDPAAAILGIFILVLSMIGLWKMFEKAKQPGWAAIVPIYNLVIYMRIIGRPWWWVILMIIPLVNIITSFYVSLDAAKVFGKNKVFGVVGLWMFAFIGTLMIGFGDAKYHRPKSKKVADRS